jgi:hypothetical protein
MAGSARPSDARARSSPTATAKPHVQLAKRAPSPLNPSICYDAQYLDFMRTALLRLCNPFFSVEDTSPATVAEIFIAALPRNSVPILPVSDDWLFCDFYPQSRIDLNMKPQRRHVCCLQCFFISFFIVIASKIFKSPLIQGQG